MRRGHGNAAGEWAASGRRVGGEWVASGWRSRKSAAAGWLGRWGGRLAGVASG